MYQEILDNLEMQLSSEEFQNITNRNIHLGVFSEPYLTKMLNGTKTIESRFSKHKILPYQKIAKNDIVLVKKSSGMVVAYFTIKEVLFFDLCETSISFIKDKYNKELCVDDEFWKLKENSRYATLIRIDHMVLLQPFAIHKKGMQTWIKLV